MLVRENKKCVHGHKANVLVRVTIAVMTKESWGGKGLVDFCFYITTHHQRKLVPELKQGAAAEAVEGSWLLA